MLQFILQENQFSEEKDANWREGIFSNASDRFEVALAFSGQNIGFGSIRARKIWIRSFGFHYHPLGQMENYGMDRESETFKDVKVVEGLEKYSITGWTRIVRGDIWTEVELIRDKSAIDLFFRIENFGPEVELATAFFISCDFITVNNQEIRANTLSRFKGPASPVTCRVGGEALTITPKGASNLQIIPLAGNNHFWGASFLVAFDISNFRDRFHINLS